MPSEFVIERGVKYKICFHQYCFSGENDKIWKKILTINREHIICLIQMNATQPTHIVAFCNWWERNWNKLEFTV